MKQKAFAWGFILFFAVIFIVLWGDEGINDLWDFIFLVIPSVFVGFLGGAIAMVVVKKKSADEE